MTSLKFHFKWDLNKNYFKGLTVLSAQTKNTQEEDTLECLMLKAQRGNAQAYNLLLRAITPIIHSKLKEKISFANDREDILQEILISVHKASNTYDLSRPFKPWLFSIVRYRINDYLRKYYSQKEMASFTSLDEDIDLLYDEKNNTDKYNHIQYVQNALSTLNQKQRNIIIMTKINGFSVREIATACNMNESTVKVITHRAMKNLAAYNHKEQSR